MRPLLLEPARQLVLRYGWNSTAYQILNPGMGHWFNAGRTAVVGHVRRAGVLVAAGGPVCDAAELGAVTAELEAHARARDERVCYFAAAERLERACRDSPEHSVVAIGAQPVWDPHGWPEIVAGRASLRAQLHRARNKNVTIRRAAASEVASNAELQGCIDQWLAHRGLPPLHFMVEPETLGGMVADRRVWIASRPSDGGAQAVAFLLASPVPQRHGWLIEQIVRTPGAPNGTVELLIDAAMRDLAAAGSVYVTLGLVALSRHAAAAMGRNPWWFRALTTWARAHGRRFYNFDGLEAFRQKLAPHRWETIYAISNEPALSPRTLYAIAAAFASGSPMELAVRVFTRAVVQELRWLRQKLRRRGKIAEELKYQQRRRHAKA